MSGNGFDGPIVGYSMTDVIESVKFFQTSYQILFNPSACASLFRNEESAVWRAVKYYAIGLSFRVVSYMLIIAYVGLYQAPSMFYFLFFIAERIIYFFPFVLTLYIFSASSFLYILIFFFYWNGLTMFASGVLGIISRIVNASSDNGDVIFRDALLSIPLLFVFINITSIVFKLNKTTAALIFVFLFILRHGALSAEMSILNDLTAHMNNKTY